MVGAPARYDAHVEINRSLRAMFPAVVKRTMAEIERLGGTVTPGSKEGRFLVNGELTLALVIARCTEAPSGALRWTVRFEPGRRPDLTVAVRMERDNVAIRDYYLLPGISLAESRLRLAEENGIFLDAFRFDDLTYLSELAARVRLGSAA